MSEDNWQTPTQVLRTLIHICVSGCWVCIEVNLKCMSVEYAQFAFTVIFVGFNLLGMGWSELNDFDFELLLCSKIHIKRKIYSGS